MIESMAEIEKDTSLRAAIAKAVELRALHAALVQGNTNNIRPSASPHFSAQDYPVFTPSYDDDDEDECPNRNNYAESWGEHSFVEETNGLFFNNEAEAETVCCSNPISKSRRHSMGDIQSLSSCNKCRPAIISSDSDTNKNSVVPLTDTHSSQRRPNHKAFSWLFPRLKKKEQDLTKDLIQANESRDAALSQLAHMKSSLADLHHKMESLEAYCHHLKKALKQQQQKKVAPKSPTTTMPVSEAVMVEGFLQIVSEARLSVKQFCRTLIAQIQETDLTLVDNLNDMLRPYNLSLNSIHSKSVSLHLEAVVNQSLYQDFENCVFQKNGAPKHLDPQQDRQARFHSFVSLRNLSWNEVLRKGTKYYSEEFSKFCDQKMSCIIATLGCTRPWPEQLLQSFFVAAKCIWLLHLLAFSFNQPLGILRVDENVAFHPNYMEDIFADRQRSAQGPSRVKVMVMPGFYVVDSVLRCKVLCRYKSVS